MIAWNLATCGEVFFDVKCSQKLVKLGYHGKPVSFHNSDPKVIDFFFFSGIRWHFSSLPPLAFPFLLDACLGCHQ